MQSKVIVVFIIIKQLATIWTEKSCTPKLHNNYEVAYGIMSRLGKFALYGNFMEII